MITKIQAWPTAGGECDSGGTVATFDEFVVANNIPMETSAVGAKRPRIDALVTTKTQPTK